MQNAAIAMSPAEALATLEQVISSDNELTGSKRLHEKATVIIMNTVEERMIWQKKVL